MNIYRDYGTIGKSAAPNNVFNITLHGLVYLATHRAGELLPARYRSFISFSFGGKNIEDFNLLACCSGNTMTRNAYADFEDLTTTYDIMDGLYYHGTHFKPYTLSLHLVSDGIDLRMLDDFLHWFKGGITRELILAEHPNRAIMARVSSPPSLDVTPAELKVTIKIDSTEYETSTTVYRGFIDIDLTADAPFWYAKLNFLVRDADLNTIFLDQVMFSDPELIKEALKVVHEDTVPITNMVLKTMHFGMPSYALIGTNLAYTLVATNLGTTEPTNWSSLSTEPGYFLYDGAYWKGARIESGNTIMGRITGAVLAEEDSTSFDLAASKTTYQFFYGGTAPSPTLLSFKIDLTRASGYINSIANTYAPRNGKEYSTITISSLTTKAFDFTTPNIITSWNKVYKMFDNISTNSSTGTNWKDLADNLRDLIRHPAVRAFAIAILSYMQSNNNSYLNSSGIFTSTGKSYCKTLLNKFFADTDGNWSKASFSFNAETGKALGEFTYWQSASSADNIISIILNNPNSQVVDDNYKTHIEDVGDMLRSNWLFIEDHNEFTSDWHVGSWEDNPKYAHVLLHNLPVSLLNLKIEYKNMYL